MLPKELEDRAHASLVTGGSYEVFREYVTAQAARMKATRAATTSAPAIATVAPATDKTPMDIGQVQTEWNAQEWNDWYAEHPEETQEWPHPAQEEPDAAALLWIGKGAKGKGKGKSKGKGGKSNSQHFAGTCFNCGQVGHRQDICPYNYWHPHPGKGA